MGTVIVQGKPGVFYAQVYGNTLGGMIIFFGADNFYASAAYRSVLFLLGLNLLSCTINTFSPAVFKSRKRCALFLLHSSVLLIFTGALVSRFTRYSEHRRLFPHDKIELIREKDNVQIVLQEFNIDFYPGSDNPSEYYSKVSVSEKGKHIRDEIIRVNHPLRVKGYSLYQSGFDVFADVDLAISHMGQVVWEGSIKQGETKKIPGAFDFDIEIVNFSPDVAITAEGKLIQNSYKLQNPALQVKLSQGEEFSEEYWVFKDEQMNKMHGHAQAFDFKIQRLEIFYATILHIVKDPGLIFVWSGFLLLISGMGLFLFKKED